MKSLWIALLTCSLALAGIAGATQPTPTPTPADSLAIVRERMKAVEKQPEGNEKTANKARLLYYQGRFTSDEKEKRRLFEEARALSKSVREKDPNNLAAIVGWLASHGELARMENPFAALGSIGDIEKAAKELAEKAPEFENAVAYRVLGVLYQEAPGFISIGSMSKAEEYFSKAMQLAPKFPGNWAYYSKFLLAKGKKEDARAMAQRVLESSEVAQYPLERADWERMAKEVVEKTNP